MNSLLNTQIITRADLQSVMRIRDESIENEIFTIRRDVLEAAADGWAQLEINAIEYNFNGTLDEILDRLKDVFPGVDIRYIQREMEIWIKWS